jgi:transglutaminase-like putative cysteine protease
VIYDLTLAITYRFDRPTGGGRQLLRIRPAIGPDQRPLSCRIEITPPPRERRGFTDFWGTAVDELVMGAGLTECRIEMRARVEKTALPRPADTSGPIAGLGAQIAATPSLAPEAPQHFLSASPRIAPDPGITGFAAQAMAGAPSTLAAVEALGRALHARMTFDPKATEVDTPPAAAFALGSGVCQDYAQIMIAGLRAQGIPAGYVAGFLRTLPPPGKKRLAGADAMHAWVMAWTGHEMGWQCYDPTNRIWAGLDHVEVARGRDYGDVAPVTGSLRTEGGQAGGHVVDLVEA